MAFANLIIVDGNPLKELSLLCNEDDSISGIIAIGDFIKDKIKLN